MDDLAAAQHPPSATEAVTEDPAGLQRTCRRAALVTLAAMVVALAALPMLSGAYGGLARYFVITQDLACLGIAAMVLWGLARFRPAPRLLGWAESMLRHPLAVAAGIGALAVGVAALGAFHGIGGFDLSRDEIMADFDATIVRSGHLLAPIAPVWRPFHAALEPMFMLPVPPGAGWVSFYLPGNAALRALVGLVASPAWTSPLLLAGAAAALFGVARRLWPDRPVAALVALALFAAAPQVLITGMTSYAMTAHLAVNLLWLWLLLRDTRASHAAAMAVGFLGCGLHQIVFHPLFVAPFLLHLALHGRRRLALAYVVAYAASCLLWVGYLNLLLSAGPHPAASGGGYLLGRIIRLLGLVGIDSLFAMVANLVRFLGWEQVFALPLLLAAGRSIARDEGLARPLAAGIGLTAAAMLLLAPYQGHGWGYRYLHGLIGNVCLLGGYGWLRLTDGRGAEAQRQALARLALATAVTLFVILPYKTAFAIRFIRPYRVAEAAIRRAPADVVLIDWSGVLFAQDLVRNDPFLRNTPKVMDLAALEDAQIAQLCRRFRVALFDRRQAGALGMILVNGRGAFPPGLQARRRRLDALGCGIPVTIDTQSPQ